jgi:hypothetical protein
MKIIHSDRNKYNQQRFYFTKDELKSILLNNNPDSTLHCCDIFNYCSVSVDYRAITRKVDMCFTFVEVAGNTIVKGEVEYISIVFDDLYEFVYNDNMKTLSLLDYREKNRIKLDFTQCLRTLNDIKANKQVKRLFVKWLIHGYISGFSSYNQIIKFYNDDIYSFYFCKYRGLECESNGCLYFHKKEETKGKKKYIGGYGIHT